MVAYYDDDVFIEGSFKSEGAKIQTNALDDYEESDELILTYIPIKEITYKESNGFGVYQCENNDDMDLPPLFVMCGTFTDRLDIGQTYRSEGTVTIRQGNKQFSIKNITKVTPTTQHGIISFMKSLDGMRYQAYVIYDHFKEQSLDVIKNHPEEILKIVKGSYIEQVYEWKKQIDECKNNYGYLSELIELGIRPEQAKKIYSEYGDTAITKIKEDPFFLLGKVRGYGFKKCDLISREMGIEPNDITRLQKGIIYVLNNMMANGSTCVNKNILVEQAIEELSIRLSYREMLDVIKCKNVFYRYKYGKKIYQLRVEDVKSDYVLYSTMRNQTDKATARTMIFKINESDIENAIKSLELSEEIVIEKDMVFLKKYYDEEFNIAYYIQQLNKNKKNVQSIDLDKMIDKYCKEHDIVLEEKQEEAVFNICKSFGGVHIINGAAGCGKTFCIKVALDIYKEINKIHRHNLSMVIIAPTGKAARVAYKATGIESYTVHKLLQFHPREGFYFNSRNRLPYDCIVIDECSMLDTNLAYQLFSAIEPYTKVIMMGDTNQLPSVGAGNVFHDFINSEKIPVTTLNVIKRQGKDSGIVVNARNIINGVPITSQKEFMDSIVIGTKTESDYSEKIKKYCDKMLESLPIEEIQILSPMKRGITGTNYLNYTMQQLYNKNPDTYKFIKGRYDITIDDEKTTYDLYFRLGDKVINTKNDYQMPWYYVENGTLYVNDSKSGITNGETGIIVKLIESRDKYGDLNRKIIVKYEDKYIVYENDFDQLELAYAITIHRSQGSEWPAVLLVLNKQHKSMIDRNLFYTGITRSKQLCITISDSETITYGVRNTRSIRRTTGLQDRLHELLQEPKEINNIDMFEFS